MHIRISPDLEKELKNIKRKDPLLTKRIEKQLILFTSNYIHPSLRTHKLTGKYENMWSISITRSIRMIYLLLEKDEAYFIDIGTHEEVYRK